MFWVVRILSSIYSGHNEIHSSRFSRLAGKCMGAGGNDNTYWAYKGTNPFNVGDLPILITCRTHGGWWRPLVQWHLLRGGKVVMVFLVVRMEGKGTKLPTGRGQDDAGMGVWPGKRTCVTAGLVPRNSIERQIRSVSISVRRAACYQTAAVVNQAVVRTHNLVRLIALLFF